MTEQTYMFHSGLKCEAFGAGASCQVSHYVLTGLCFPRTTFTTKKTEKYRFNIIHALGQRFPISIHKGPFSINA